MKKIFFLSLALVALVSCKQAEPEQTPDIPGQPEGAILVRSGGVYGADVTKAGPRPIEGGTFVLKTDATAGDKIGVAAVYSTKPDLAPDAPVVSDAPNWTTLQFENLPAEAIKATDGLTGVVDFKWIGEYQFFDKGKYIHLFAYYPYADGTAATEGVTYTKNSTTGATGGAKPTISVELLPESINEKVISATTVITQPDVMFAQHADGLLTTGTAPSLVAAPQPINRKSNETSMRLKFKHVLSQLFFKIMKSNELQGQVHLMGMTIKVPKKATFTLGDGMAPTVVTPEPMTDADYTTYTITPTQNAGAGEFGVLLGDYSADGSTAVPVNKAPLMMYSFTQEQLKKCKVTMKLHFENYGIVNFPLVTAGNDNKMNLDAFGAEGMKQGAKNTIIMTVNHVGIALQGVIAPWVEKLHASDIVLD